MLFRLAPSWFVRPATGFVASTSALVALTAILAPLLEGGQILNVALLFFLAVLLASAAWGYPVGLFTAVLADLLLNFFFVPPLHTFVVDAGEAVVALLLFLAVAVVGASMLSLLRREVRRSQSRAAEANVLLQVNQALAAAGSPERALEEFCAVVAGAFGADACAILEDRGGWNIVASTPGESRPELTRDEEAMAAQALHTHSITGRGGAAAARGRTFRRVRGAPSPVLFVPFPAGVTRRGVLRIAGALRDAPPSPERLLFALAAEASVSLERAALAVEAGEAEVFRRADALKALLLSSMSHDLRSPLTAIKAAVGNLRDPAVSWSEPDQEGFLEAIEEQADRLTATVEDLLQMSRLEEGIVEPLVEAVQVSLLLRDAAQSAKHITGERVIAVESDDALWVRADYGLLMRALGNLIDNAARYSLPGGCIRLSASERDGKIHVIVHDEGPGIAREDLPRVFEKFYRGAQARRSTGTGLGLSIVQTIAELSGGRVSVRSGPRGTEFDLELSSAGGWQ